MKNILVTVIFLLFTLCLTAQDFDFVVGKIENYKPVLTINQDVALKSLSKNLFEASAIKETFTAVSITQVKDDSYSLVFKGANYRTTFAVKAIGATLFAKSKVSCTTTGKECIRDRQACRPTDDVGSCACTACPGEEVCTKTCSSANLIK